MAVLSPSVCLLIQADDVINDKFFMFAFFVIVTDL